MTDIAKKYVANWAISGLGREVAPGDVLQLPDDKAAELVQLGALKLLQSALETETAPPRPTKGKVKDAE
jgi:hypothetical protein